MQDKNEYIPASEENANKKKINPILLIIPSVAVFTIAAIVIIALIFFNNPKNKVMHAFAVALGDNFPFSEYVKGLNISAGNSSSFFNDAETMASLKEAYDNKQFYTESSFKLNSLKSSNSTVDTSALSGIKIDSALFVDKPGRRIQYRLTPGYLIVKGPKLIFTQEDNTFSFYSPSVIDDPLTIDTENFGVDYNSSELADMIGYHFPANVAGDISFNPFDMTEGLDEGDSNVLNNLSKSSLKSLYDSIEVKKTGRKELISTSVGQSEECSEYLVTIPGNELSEIVLPILESYGDRYTDFLEDNSGLINALCVSTGSDYDTLMSEFTDNRDDLKGKTESLFSNDWEMTVWLNSKDELRKTECDLFDWEISEAGSSAGSYKLILHYTDSFPADMEDIDLIITKKNTTLTNKTRLKQNTCEYDISVINVSEDSEIISLSYLADYDIENETMKISSMCSFEDRKLNLEGECDVIIEPDNGPCITFDFDHITLDYNESGNQICTVDISEEFTLSCLSTADFEDVPSNGVALFNMSRHDIYTTVSDGMNNYLNNSWAFSASSTPAVTADDVENLFSSPLLLYLIGSGL